MAKRKKRLSLPRPTDAELSILRVIWDRGPSTVRDVHDCLVADRKTTFNTTLKLMSIMHEKGLVTRDDSRRPHVYESAVPAGQTQRQLLADLLDRAFGGAANKLVAALTETKISARELAEIRQLIDAYGEHTDDRPG